MTRRPALRALSIFLALLVAACTQAQATPTSPAATAVPGVSGAPGAGSSPSPGQPANMDQAEASLRKENRDRAGLQNLGSSASELAGLMDADGYRALQAASTKMGATIAVTAGAPTARLVDLTTPGSVIFAPWEFTTTFYERLMTNGVGNTRITNDRDTLPSCIPGNGTCTGKEPPRLPPGEDSGTVTQTGDPATDKVTIGGQPGTVTSTVSSTVAFNGSKVSIDLQITVHGEVHDANGATVLRIDSVGKGHIDGDACPDASGIAAAHISFTASESYSGSGVAGSSYGLEQDFSADVRIRADDNANLAGIEIVAKAHETSKGGVPPAGGGSSNLAAHEYNAGFTRTLGYDATAGFGTATTTNESADSTQATSLYLGMALFTEFPAKFAAKAAETAWRSGMCIRVSASPNGGDVAKESRTQVRVIVRQRYENAEIDKPVEATLDSGPKSVDPAGQGQPAPATFTYMAGPKDGDVGTVTFKSTSNRGIGKTSVFFKVGGGWTADRDLGEQSIRGQKCGGFDGVWTVVAKIKGGGIDSTQTWVATINGTTLVGTYTYKGVTNSTGGFVTTTTGNGRASIAAESDGTLNMTIAKTTVTSTAVGAGGEETVKVPIPDQFFTWKSGGTCP